MSTTETEKADFDWLDPARDRLVPVRIHYPSGGERLPVILHSHGLGGSRLGYSYLGRHWAAAGYAVVHMQHQGSDSAVWMGQDDPKAALRQAGNNPQAAIDRIADVVFTLDQLERLSNHPGPLQGRLELSRIGMSGHSFGAYTTLAVAGQVFFTPRGEPVSYRDRRIRAAIAMSPPAPRDQSRLDEVFGEIALPCLHLTGTRDDSPIRKIAPEERRLPYRHIDQADQFLVVLEGGNHMVFVGPGLFPSGEKDRVLHGIIKDATTLFWAAYLRGDADGPTAARQIELAVGNAGQCDWKPAAPAAGRGAQLST